MIKNIVDIQNNKIIIKDGFFGIDSTNPQAKLQIGEGNSLSTNPILLQVADTMAVIKDGNRKRVGIGKYPEEDLDVDGNIQISSSGQEKITFYDTGHGHEHGKLLFTDDGNGAKFEIFTKNASSGNVEKTFTINNQGALGFPTHLTYPNFGTPGQIIKSNGTNSVYWDSSSNQDVIWTPYVEPFGLANIGGLVTMDNQKAYYSSFYTSSALRYDRILLYTTEATVNFTGHIGVAIFDSNNSAVGTNKLQEGILQYTNSLSSGQELSIDFSNPVVLNSNSKYWVAIAIDSSSGSLGIAKSSSVNTDNIHIRKESSTNFSTSGFSSVVSTTNSNLNFWYRLYNSQVSTFNDFTDLSTELSLFEVNGTNVVSRFTINNQGAFGIGTNPNFGTPGQILTSQGTNSVTWEDTINYTAGTGVTISPSNVISIGQDVSTTNLVTFKSLDLLKDYTGFPILPPVMNFSDSLNGGVLATIYMESDGTSGGRLLFSTRDGSQSNERLRINRYGAIGIGGANYGSPGQVLTSNGSGTAVSWGSGGTTYTAGTGVSISPSNVISIGQAVGTNSNPRFNELTISPPYVVTTGGGGGSISTGILNFGHTQVAQIQSFLSGTGDGEIQIFTHEVSSGGLAGKLTIAKTGITCFNQLTLGNSGTNQGILNLQDLTNNGTDTIAQIKGLVKGANGGEIRIFTKKVLGGLTERLNISDSGTTMIKTDGIGLAIFSEDGVTEQGFIYNDLTGPKDVTIEAALGSVVGVKGIQFKTNGGTTRMRIDFNGNVGIGTTNPSQKLEVNGNIMGTDVYANGNVGIGTTNPSQKLEVNGNIKGTDVYANKILGTDQKLNPQDMLVLQGAAGSGRPDMRLEFESNNTLNFDARNYGDGNNQRLTFGVRGTPSNGLYSILDLNATIGGSATSSVARLIQANIPFGVSNLTTAAGNYSDDRMKFNETSLTQETAINLIQQLTIKDYMKTNLFMTPEQEQTFENGGDGFAEYKTYPDNPMNPNSFFDPFREVGVIAQEVPEDVSFIVSPGDSEKIYHVKYNNITSLNTCVIQNLLQRVAALEARISTLENN